MGLVTGCFSLVGIQEVISYEYIYKLTQYNVVPDTPVSSNAEGSVPEGWSSQLLGVSASLPYLWESRRQKKDSYVTRDLSSSSFTRNYWIGTNGVASYSNGYSYSEVFDLPSGQTIEVLTAGTGFSVISKYSNRSYTPIVKASGSVSEQKMYTYTADTDCQIVVSVYHLSTYSVKITSGTWSAWSTPTLKSSWGKQGAKMRMRTWTADTEYLSGADGEDFYDVVIYLEKLYLCTKTHTSKSGTNDPVTSINGYLGFWESAQEWTFVATELLLAEKIKAEQIDATGLTATDVDISGEITAKSGKIGGWNINGNNLICNGFDTKIMIEASGERFMRINYDEQIMCYIRADSSTGIRVYTYGDNVDTRGISVTSNGKGIALEVLGDVLLKARSGENVEINGLKFNYRVVSDYSLLYTNDDIVIFKNRKAITFNMASNAKKGKIIYMKKETVGSDVTMNGMFMRADGVGTMETFTIGDERSRIFLYDGTYWLEFYCG